MKRAEALGADGGCLVEWPALQERGYRRHARHSRGRPSTVLPRMRVTGKNDCCLTNSGAFVQDCQTASKDILANMTVRRFRAGILAAMACSLGWALPASATASQTYSVRCATCHQISGAGLPGLYPRLKGRAGAIAGSKEGRTYLIKVTLFGLLGPIEVDGKRISGMMPPTATLSDQDVAEVLNHAVNLEKPQKAVPPFTAAEVKAVRATGPLTAAQVAKARAAAVLHGAIL